MSELYVCPGPSPSPPRQRKGKYGPLPKPAEVPTPEAITAQVTSAVTAAGIAGQVQAAVDAAIAAHKTEIEALKLEITNMKGKQLNKTHEQNGTGEFVPSGKFSKA